MVTTPHPESTGTAQDVVQRIRREHWEISSYLSEIESLADRVQRGDEEATVTLRDRLRELQGMMQGHLHLEEYELVPLMQKSQRYDEASIEALREDHAGQRELLDRIISELRAHPSGGKLAIETRELVRAIRDDMAHEESELLVHINEE